MRAGRHPQRHRGARRWTDTHHPTLPNPLFGREPQRTLEGKLVRIALVYGDPQKYDILWVVTHADADKLEGGELDQTRRRSEKLEWDETLRNSDLRRRFRLRREQWYQRAEKFLAQLNDEGYVPSGHSESRSGRPPSSSQAGRDLLPHAGIVLITAGSGKVRSQNKKGTPRKGRPSSRNRTVDDQKTPVAMSSRIPSARSNSKNS